MNFWKRNKSLTVEEAIAKGIIDPEAIQRNYVPRTGVSVKYYTNNYDEAGRVTRRPKEQVFYPAGWDMWRNDLRSRYLGGKGTLAVRDIRSGIREPIMDLGAGVTDLDYNAALGFLVDQGIANRKRA